ncbi:MAG TPA: FxsA family protein [Mycobacterium sp.]
MVSRLFVLYAVVELAVVVALASTIGLAWTLLLLLAAFLAGITLAGSQLKRQLTRLQSGLTTASDGVLVALGTVLVVVPGLVTSVAGLLLLLPPTRAAARPALAAMASRGVDRPAPDYIDGEVLDVTDVTEVDPPVLPRRPK